MQTFISPYHKITSILIIVFLVMLIAALGLSISRDWREFREPTGKGKPAAKLGEHKQPASK